MFEESRHKSCTEETLDTTPATASPTPAPSPDPTTPDPAGFESEMF